MKTFKKLTLLLLSGFFISAFTYSSGDNLKSVPVKMKDSACHDGICEASVLPSMNFGKLSDSFYNSIFDNQKTLNRNVFNYALKGYINLLKQGILMKRDTMTIIDYSLSANVRRLWVIDLKNQAVLFHELVAHGKNSGEEYARKFSNASNSFKSSLGFFLTGDIYDGKHEMSIKLFGIEHKFNGKAFERGIVIHGAHYVSESFISENQRLGRSQGCPAVSEGVIDDISRVISKGTCLFAYYPNKSYLRNSRLLK